MAVVANLYAVGTSTQLIAAANIPQVVALDMVLSIKDFTLDTATGIATCNKNGKYFYNLSAQVGRIGKGQSVVPNIKIWVKKNGANVEESCGLININRYRTTKDRLSIQGMLDLCVNDTLRFFMTSNASAETYLQYIPSNTIEPAVSSASLLINKVDEDV